MSQAQCMVPLTQTDPARPHRKRRPVCWALALLLTACANSPPDNALIGDWQVNLPTTPRAHGNIIGFRKACLIVRGNWFDVRVARPITYLANGAQLSVWYGPPAGEVHPNPALAARVTFLAPDRIRVVWPEGFVADYMRTLGTQASNRDCRVR